MSHRVSTHRWWALLAIVVLAAPMVLAGCGGDSTGTPTLTWYINPDDGGQATLAQECGEQSGGAYRITTQVLPNNASDQRDQLIRRLAAGDSSIDLMSLDPVFVAEFANAGYLMPVTDPADVDQLTADVLPAALEAAYWEDQLVAAPFWANTQLLWYRKSVAQAAGVDPTADGFTWEQMIEAAESQGKTVAVQGNRYEGYMVWINALTESAGGQILTNTEAGDEATPSMAGPAGDTAADIVGKLARSSAAPPGLSTATEEEARSTFQSGSGGFMVNWPYVYAAAKSAVTAGGLDQAVVDDIGWARYPRADAAQDSRPPLGGINLGIGEFSKHQAEALDAVKCITSVENNAQYMVEAGNPAARAAAYDDPAVKEAFPMADLIRASIADAGPRPITPYYGDVSSSVQRVWHPAASVQAPETPEETDSYMADVLSGKRLL
jgi:multiple sugar transport system substrate-binding protein